MRAAPVKARIGLAAYNAFVPEKGSGVYNAVVLGAGTAGLVAAAGTAGLGGRVALVERHRMGGDCLNTGCVPSKALLSSARAADAIRHADRHGLEPGAPRFDFSRVLAHMRERRAALAPNDSQERFESLGVDVFRGQARFVSPHEVVVTGAGGNEEARLSGRNFVIATGSRPTIPRIEGLDAVPYYTNETVFDELSGNPGRLAILGGGPIGCELGQAFARLGARVTIIQTAPQILEKEDADAAGLVRRSLEADGVRILTGASGRRVSREAGALSIAVETSDGRTEALDADAILVAAGRTPNTAGLGLEAAGVAFTKKGVTVDANLRTSRPHIYAAGDVAGVWNFTHMADSQARTIVRNILLPWLPARAEASVVPWCTYTSPEVARVGLNEEQARRRKIPCDVITQPMKDVDRAVIEGEDAGWAKVLLAKGTDRILGVTLVAERAGDLLHEFVLAMKAGVGLATVAATVHAYPTLAEIAKKVADRQQKSRLTPFARRVLAWRYRRARSGA